MTTTADTGTKGPAMTDLRTAAQMALDALEQLQGGCTDSYDGTVEAITVWCPEVVDALRAALSAPAAEAVAWAVKLPERAGGGYYVTTRPENLADPKWIRLVAAPSPQEQT